nr:hypothetical protein Q903MT_gene4430 [Picea sitchensis]
MHHLKALPRPSISIRNLSIKGTKFPLRNYLSMFLKAQLSRDRFFRMTIEVLRRRGVPSTPYAE